MNIDKSIFIYSHISMVILFMAASPGHSGWSSKGHVTWDAQLISSPMAYSYIHSLETNIFNPGCLGDLLGMKSYPVIYGLEYTIIRIPTKQVVFSKILQKKITATWGDDPIWLAHIFQMGWFNHQLGMYSPLKINGCFKWISIFGEIFCLIFRGKLVGFREVTSNKSLKDDT